MAVDITEQIKQHLRVSSLPKIDPNTQQPEQQEITNTDVESAAIPVVLAGYYKNTRNVEDAEKLINRSNEGILNELFKEKTDEVIRSVSDCAKTDNATAQTTMEKAVVAVKKVLSENVKEINGSTVMNFFTEQRSNILKHLPVELHAGEFLNDPAMDDKTNKMEGPMSDLMHNIEKIFSSSK